MFKNMMTFMLLTMISTASITVLANVNNVTKIGVNSKISSNIKINNVAPQIRLAVNDATRLQRINTLNLDARNVLDKNSTSGKSSVEIPALELDKIAPEAWLMVGALFCFVMRSSRRSV